MQELESLREVESLRFRFQMNNRLRLEALAELSKLFREFGEPISDDLLSSLVFALPQELVSNGHGYVKQAGASPIKADAGGPPASPKPGPHAPSEQPKPGPSGPPAYPTREPSGPPEYPTREPSGPPEYPTREPSGPPAYPTREPSGPPAYPTQEPSGPPEYPKSE